MTLFLDLFWRRVRMADGDGCWEWHGQVGKNGYGVCHSRQRLYAHRTAWELARHREIPAGLHVLHHCDNKRCVRPDHLYVGTHSDNMQDAWDRHRISYAPKGHCRHGHALTPDNVRIVKDARGPYRQCATCYRENVKKHNDLARTRERVGPIPHGTRNGYNHFRCRCADCRAAGRRYHAKRVEISRELAIKQRETAA